MLSRVAAGLALAVLLAGCSGGGDPAAAPAPVATSDAPAPTAVPLPSCAAVGQKPGFAWPKPVPPDLPVPPGGVLGESRTTADGLTLVEFRTPTSLREGVVFLVDNLAKRGYTLGRGDAEQTEADAPFVKADLRGVYRMISRSTCETDWLLAITKRTVSAGTGSPLLPARPGQGSPSPLPFG